MPELRTEAQTLMDIALVVAFVLLVLAVFTAAVAFLYAKSILHSSMCEHHASLYRSSV